MKKSLYILPIVETFLIEMENGVVAASAFDGGSATPLFPEDDTIDWKILN